MSKRRNEQRNRQQDDGLDEIERDGIINDDKAEEKADEGQGIQTSVSGSINDKETEKQVVDEQKQRLVEYVKNTQALCACGDILSNENNKSIEEKEISYDMESTFGEKGTDVVRKLIALKNSNFNLSKEFEQIKKELAVIIKESCDVRSTSFSLNVQLAKKEEEIKNLKLEIEKGKEVTSKMWDKVKEVKELPEKLRKTENMLAAEKMERKCASRSS